jgi:hypothetical protein
MTRMILFLSGLAVLLSAGGVQAVDFSLAYWRFPQTAPSQNFYITWPLAADTKLNSGTAQITTDAPVWDGTTTPVDALHQGAFQYFTGTTIEALNLDPAGQALSMRALTGPPYPSEGKSMTFQFDATGYSGIGMVMADRYTSTGPTHVDVSWSTDGTSFTSVPAWGFDTTRDSTFRSHSLDFSSVVALNNCASDYIKLTFTGFSGNSGSARFDNIRFIPEPASLGLLLIGGLLSMRRR